MTLEATNDEIWLRCACDDTTLCIERHHDGTNLRIEAYAEPGSEIERLVSSLSLDDPAPVSTIIISPAEAVMLAHGLIDLVARARATNGD